MIRDLPLPLRLRNALAKAGFNDEQQLKDWLSGTPMPGLDDGVIPGVGPTGMKALRDWADAANAAPTLSRSAPRVELDASSRWNPPALPAFDKEIQRRSEEFRARGGSVVVGDGRGLLALRLEVDIQDRLRAMIPVIKGLAHVKELGVEVSAETVGRMALIRGLDALERAHRGQNRPETAEKEAKSADPSPEDAVPTPDPDAEVHETPPGWSKCGPTDKIPVPEAVLHDYYTQNGWSRYWGMVDGTPIYFYWSPEKRLQDLDPFPGSDKSGRKVAIQGTPWGPGHVVPVKWANA
jgi:hypothetical protein